MQQIVNQNVIKKDKFNYSKAIYAAVQMDARTVVVLAQHLLNIALTGNSTLYKLRSDQI